MATANIWDINNFNHEKVSAVLGIGETEQTIVTLVTPNLPAGEYFIGYSFQVDYNGTKDKPAFFKLTGTFPDTDFFSGTAPANGDKRNRMYGYPKVWAGGVMTINLVMHRDAALPNFDCDFADVWVERKA